MSAVAAVKGLPPMRSFDTREQLDAAIALLPAPAADVRFPRPARGHNWRDVAMPFGVTLLERDPRGYPIFYALPRKQAREGDFSREDARRVVTAITARLCGICGQHLGASGWFVGGEQCAVNGIYTEPPAHQDCLAYALQVCPYLLSGRARRRYEPDAGTKYAKTTGGTLDKPQLFYLIRATRWQLKPLHRSVAAFLGDRREIVAWEPPLP